MTRVLKVPRTGMYVGKTGRCTQRFSEAVEFPDIPSALQFCRRHRLHKVELLMRTNEPEYDLTIPLTANQTPLR
jgi:hypothetical protein